MANANVMHSLVNIFVGVLIIGTCVPLVRGKIKMNWWYGIRIKKAFESEENWYKINKYGAQRLILWSMVPLLTGILTLLVPIGYMVSLLLAICVPTVFICIIPIIEILLFARKL